MMTYGGVCQKAIKDLEPHVFYSLVMAGRHFKLAEEYVSVAKVTVGPPLSGLIPKLFSDEQPLPDRTNSRVHVKVRINGKQFEASTIMEVGQNGNLCG